MAKHRHSRRHTRRHISRSRKMRGGSYTSASTYGAYVNGTPDSQFSRTFDATGPYASRAGSEYVGAQGQWSQQQNVPTSQNLSLIQILRHYYNHFKILNKTFYFSNLTQQKPIFLIQKTDSRT